MGTYLVKYTVNLQGLLYQPIDWSIDYKHHKTHFIIIIIIIFFWHVRAMVQDVLSSPKAQ